MDKQQTKEKQIEDLYDDVKSYVNLRVQHTKLTYVEKGTRIMADLVTNTTVIVCFVLAFLFGSVTLAFYLSEILGSYSQGFGAVALIYLLISIIVFLTKDRFIERILVNIFIRKYFNKVADKDEEQ